MKARNLHPHGRASFTLLEVVFASFLFAVLFAALLIPFRGALKMRENAHQKIEDKYQIEQVLRRITGELQNLAPPGSVFSSKLIGENEEIDNYRRDTITFASTKRPAAAENAGTASSCWSKIELSCEDSEDDSSQCKWIYSLTRNPLAQTEEPEEQTILENISGVEFTYYDGSEWQDSWDSETSGLPKAISLTITLPPETDDLDKVSKTYSAIIPIIIEEESSEGANDTGGTR